MENSQNNNTSNKNDQPLVSLVNLISDNLNNQNKNDFNRDENNINNINNNKENKKQNDDILLEIDQIIGNETIENAFSNSSTKEENNSNSNISDNKVEISENHFLKNNDNNYSSNNNFSKESLDEAIITTIYRDLYSVYIKLILVINPLTSDEVKKKHIRQWDLWGPLLFTVFLACTLAINSNDKSQTVILIFLIFWVGSFLVFLNSNLLGVKISIFQIFCLLGYCLFPLNISSFIFCFIKTNDILKLFFIGLTCFWSLFSVSRFLKNLANSEQRYLVLYPVILLYFFISWFIFTNNH
jgi:hypothetical protein